MSFFKMARPDKADTLFSQGIRERDGQTCQFCGAQPLGGKGLDNSHFWGRNREGTRFDLENCDAFCKRCHMRLETEKAVGRDYYNWKLGRLGQERFDALEVRARTYCKKDRAMVLLWVKAWIADLRKGRPQIMGSRS